MEYNVSEKRYTTICSIHEEIKNIFIKLNNLKSTSYNDSESLLKDVHNIISHGLDFVDVAFEMGTRMEHHLKRQRELDNYLGLNSTDILLPVDDEREI